MIVNNVMGDTFIVVRNSDVIKRMDTRKILFVSVDGDCSTFCLEEGERFSFSKSLKEVLKVFYRSNF
jgi:DNA-binding LytR/AlgR family response regulator